VHSEPAPSARQRRSKEAQPDTGFPRAIGRPAASALNAAGYIHLDQLRGVPESELFALRGFGPKAMRIIRETLAAQAEANADADPE
jgi:predicted flap endonuclease-1-like 5' DNA nuclease